MTAIQVPEKFQYIYRDATPEFIEDLYSAGQQLKAKGKSQEEIAARITEAGWNDQFAQWYAQVLLENEDQIELVLNKAVVMVEADPELEKSAALHSSGVVVSIVGTLFLALLPLMKIEDPMASFICVAIGIAVLWEGFARLAASKGLSRVYGACSIMVLLTNIAMVFLLVPVLLGADKETLEGFRPQLMAMSAILPTGFAWLVFWIGKNSASGRRKS